MTAKDLLLKFIEPIKNVSGTNDKKHLLGLHKSDSSVLKLLDLCYNPSIQYGVKKLPIITFKSKHADLSDNYSDIISEIINTNISGNNLKDYLILMLSNSNESNYNLLQLILDRNLRIGIDAKTINSIIGTGFIKVFKPIKPRGTYHKKFLPLQYDFKFNGQRMCIEKENGVVLFYSSSGIVFDIPYIKEQAVFLLSEVDNVRLDCEIDGFPHEFGIEEGNYADDTVRLITNGWINSTLSSKERSMTALSMVSKLRVSVFDMVSLQEAYRSKKEAYINGVAVGETLKVRTKRRDNLFKGVTLYNIKNAEYGELITNDQVLETFLTIISKGGEGIIGKKPDSVYHAGETQEWFKLKNIAVADLEIVGFKTGGARTKNAGKVTSIVVASSCRKLEVAVGSGLMQEDIDYLDDLSQQALLGTVVEVTFTNSIKRKGSGYSLFLPRFTGGGEGVTNLEASIREDKEEALTIEEVKIAELDCAKRLLEGKR